LWKFWNLRIIGNFETNIKQTNKPTNKQTNKQTNIVISDEVW